MKAAVVRQFGAPLVIEDRPVPAPVPGQVTVRMEASGVCHTDIHAAHGDLPVCGESGPHRSSRIWAVGSRSAAGAVAGTTGLCGCTGATRR